MTVYKPIQNIAFQAARIAMKFAKEEEVETRSSINNGKINLVPSTIITQMFSVTKDNLEPTVLFERFHTRKELSK